MVFSSVMGGLLSLLRLTAAVYTGFSYGSHWDADTEKTYDDFLRAFNDAKALPDVPVPFNSARLFTSIQWKTDSDPIAAFQAAIDTNTTLLLGIWLPSITKELEALDKAFEKYGKELADLVVGISVGNEDIYRSSETCGQKENKQGCPGAASADEVTKQVAEVRQHIASSKYADLLQGKPIGHVDVAKNAAEPQGMDFVGMTAYPYWAGDDISNANKSFFDSLKGVQDRAGAIPVWIAETGWPLIGEQQKSAGASVENLQEYWAEVGCSLFGKYNVWWFELEDDSNEVNMPEIDWGILDSKTRARRIDLRCPGKGRDPDDPQAVAPPSSNPPASTFITLPSPGQSKASQASASGATRPSTSSDGIRKTVYVTERVCVTVFDAGSGKMSTLGTTIFTDRSCASPTPIIPGGQPGSSSPTTLVPPHSISSGMATSFIISSASLRPTNRTLNSQPSIPIISIPASGIICPSANTSPIVTSSPVPSSTTPGLTPPPLPVSSPSQPLPPPPPALSSHPPLPPPSQPPAPPPQPLPPPPLPGRPIPPPLPISPPPKIPYKPPHLVPPAPQPFEPPVGAPTMGFEAPILAGGH